VPVTRATVFVDWDCARRLVPFDMRRGRSAQNPEHVLRQTRYFLAEALYNWWPTKTFRVSMRLYHGWHRGQTETLDRRAFRDYLAKLETVRIGSISFAPEVDFSGELLCGSRRGPIVDTLRRRSDGTDEQKMVDTSLVCDLLHFVRTRRRQGAAIVLGDDDDLLPGVFTAEAWGGLVRVARLRAFDNPHFDCKDLIYRMEPR
jgi:hypothetical protein